MRRHINFLFEEVARLKSLQVLLIEHGISRTTRAMWRPRASDGRAPLARR
jgi:hypothetical protein